MPSNPILNIRRNLGTNTASRQAMTPIPEQYEGSNHPYRGIEQHGVEDTVRTSPVPGYEDNAHPVEYEIDKEPPAPIPVKIVTEGGDEIIESRVFTMPITNVASRVLNQMRSRKTATIKNLGPNTVYLAPNADVLHGTWNAFPLKAGDSQTITAHTNMWAIAAPAKGAGNYRSSGATDDDLARAPFSAPGAVSASGNTVPVYTTVLGPDIAGVAAIGSVSALPAGNTIDIVMQTSEDNIRWVDISNVVTMNAPGNYFLQAVGPMMQQYRIAWRNLTGAVPGATLDNIHSRMTEYNESSSNPAIPQQAVLAVYMEYAVG